MAFIKSHITGEPLLDVHTDEGVHTSFVTLSPNSGSQIIMYEKEKGKAPVFRIFDEQKEKYTGYVRQKEWMDVDTHQLLKKIQDQEEEL